MQQIRYRVVIGVRGALRIAIKSPVPLVVALAMMAEGAAGAQTPAGGRASPQTTVEALPTAASIDERLRSAEAYYRLGETDAALQEVSAVLRLQPDHSGAIQLRKQALEQRVRIHDRLSGNVDRVRQLVERGNRAAALKSWESARVEFEQALALDPANRSAQDGLGRAHLELAARADRRAALDAARAALDRARVRPDPTDTTRVLEIFRDAARRDPSDAAAVRGLTDAEALISDLESRASKAFRGLKDGDIEEAINLYTVLAHFDPENSAAESRRKFAISRRDEGPRQSRALQIASLRHHAEEEMRQDHWDNAIQLYEWLIDLDGNDATAKDRLSQARASKEAFIRRTESEARQRDARVAALIAIGDAASRDASRNPDRIYDATNAYFEALNIDPGSAAARARFDAAARRQNEEEDDRRKRDEAAREERIAKLKTYANEMYERGSWGEAARGYREIYDYDKEEVIALSRLRDAEARLRVIATRQRQRQIDSWLAEADRALALGQLDSAIEGSWRVLKLDSDSREARRIFGLAHERKGTASALAGPSFDRDETSEAIQRAQLLERGSRFADAEQVLRDLRDELPSLPASISKLDRIVAEDAARETRRLQAVDECVGRARRYQNATDWRRAGDQASSCLGIDRAHTEAIRIVEESVRRQKGFTAAVDQIELRRLKGEARKEYEGRQYEKALKLSEQALVIDSADLEANKLRDAALDAVQEAKYPIGNVLLNLR